MTRSTPRTRGEELLLARISAAAGRAHLGRRLATHTTTAYRARTRNGPFRPARWLPALARYGRSPATRASPNARLDLYEHGLTVAVKGRIHVVRYDTTSVFRHRTRPRDSSPAGATLLHTLTDIEHKRLVLRGGPDGGDARDWEHEIQRAVTRAQLPGALATLHRGERVSFGDVWLSREHLGIGERCTPWARVQRIGVVEGFLQLTVDGEWRRWGPPLPRIPNLFVFWALVERCRTDGTH
ncbi:DUF6585 family protein [Streptomyces sp. NPDC057743]|uniref:DUF6585 family protein n=1 Tax=Streptomyces sp. NPDC057743 TaxID=3346236 RepID=UPI00369B1CAA